MILHFRCGDDILPRLQEGAVPGRAAKWADPLCEGPLRPWPNDEARRVDRAAFLASRYLEDEDRVRADLEDADRALEGAGEAEEVVLWFEHDLFDQSILVFLLTRLADLSPDRTSLICVDSHPEIEDFVGLGLLDTPQLTQLFPTRVPVGQGHFDLARHTWRLLCTGDPEGLWALGENRSPELPHVGPAFRRYLAELPSVRNGLSLTESLALHAIAAGADKPQHAFRAARRFEPVVWQGDGMFYATLRALGEGPAPLLKPVTGHLLPLTDPGFPAQRLELTPEGRAVLTGRLDWCRLWGAARWLGGILVEGPEPTWRWDEREERPMRRED